jgi:streptogramin lyase
VLSATWVAAALGEGAPTYKASVGSYGSGNGQFSHPSGVTLDPEGDLWVADQGNDRIQKFNEAGEYVSQIGSSGSGNGQFASPKAIAIDAEGNLWVADSGHGRLEQFDDEGKFIKAVGSPGSSNGHFSGPEDIAIDAEGNLWVADTYNYRIQKLDDEGEFIEVVSPGGLGAIEPTGIDAGPAGKVWVTDWAHNRVVALSEAGALVSQFGSGGSGNGEFSHPDGIDVDSEGNVWVGDEGHGRVQKFNEKGEYLDQFGSVGSGEGEFSFSYPFGIVADSGASIWIADSSNNRVQKWSTSPIPSCDAGSASTEENEPLVLKAGALQCEGEAPLSYEVVSGPEHGEISGFDSETGALTYTPDSEFTGLDSFTFKATNGLGSSAIKSFTIAVGEVAVCHDGEDVTVAGVALVLKAGALQCEGEAPLSYEVVSGPEHGEISEFDSETGAMTYTSDLEYSGLDSFTFRATNALGPSATQTFQIIVQGVPRCGDGWANTEEGHPLVLEPGALECEGEAPLSYEIVSGPEHGEISGFDSETGALTYTPDSEFSGFDSFTFKATNGVGSSAPKTFEVAVGNPPSCESAGASTPEETALPIQLSCEGSPPFTYYIDTGPIHGEIIEFDPESGTLTYVPESGYSGPDLFEFFAPSPFGGSDLATFEINVGDGGSVTFQFSFGSNGSEDGQFNHPAGLASDNAGHLWVVDEFNNRLEEFNYAGEYLAQFGSGGSEPGQFERPTAVAINPEGDLWVTDAENNRIEKFNGEGEFLQAVGSSGSSDGQFAGPEGIAIDPEGNIWVADTYNSRVQEFDPEGEFLQVVGSYGSEEGQLGVAADVDVAPNGDIWIADRENDRISVFDSSGEFVRQFGSTGSGNGQFRRPDAIDVDAEGNAWVGDRRNDRVEKFDEAGEYLSQFGIRGEGPGRFYLSDPFGLEVDESGHIWVADPENNRVQSWLEKLHCGIEPGAYTDLDQPLALGPGDLTCKGAGPLEYEIISGPEHGEITEFDPETGALSYGPDSAYLGLDSFTFKVHNGKESVGPVSFQIIVGLNGSITPTREGAKQEVAFSAPSQIARYAVPVSAGESVSIRTTGAALSENFHLEWLSPGGEPVMSQLVFAEVSEFVEAVRFDESGTATLIVDPEGAGTGTEHLTVYDASDKTGTITPTLGGSTKSFSVDVPGQRTRISFEASEGQWISILPTGADFEGSYSVDTPEGSPVTDSGGDLESGHGPLKLPESGTYEVILTGREGETGSVHLCVRLIEEASRESSCGPVAAFSFNEGPGDLVRSERGDLTGLVDEPEWTNGGRFGGALEFDGTDDTMTIPDSSTLDLAEGFTLEAWVRPWTSSGFGDIFAKEASESPFYSYLFYAYAEGEGPRGIAGAETWTSSSAALPTNAWRYVAFTSDGSETHVYVNGELKASGGATPLPATDGPLQIGGNAIWGDHFYGRIDEVRLYDRPLTGAEIGADMGMRVPTAPRPEPVVALGFDEDEGDAAHDSVGRSNALLQDTEWSDGRFGSGIEFDGEGDPAHVNANAAMDFPREFTADAWVKPEASGGTETIISKRDSDEALPFGYRLYLNGEEGALAADIADSEGSSPSLEAAEPLPLGVWSHVALTSDGSEARLYVDGLLVASEASVPSKPTDGPLEIGGAEGGEDRFQGQIDEVRLYRARLSSEEIRRDMEVRVTPSHGEPSMALRFDADVEDVALDSAGDHDGTIHGAAHAPDRDGHVLELDGEADRVTVPDAQQLDLQDEGFALSAWVYPTSSESWSPLIVKGDPGEVGPDYDFALYSQGGEEGPAMAVVSEEGTPEMIDGEAALPLETWSLVTATASAGQMRLYVDGELVAGGSGSTPRLSAGNVEIGGSTAVGHYFSGEIDDVELYDEALSAKEVADARDAAPPKFDLSGPLFESRGGPLGVESADLYIDPTDPGEEASGVRSVEVFVDGRIAEVFRCGCEEALTFAYDSAVWGKGRHTVTVSATDRRDFETEQSFTIDESEGPGIEYGGPLFLRKGNPMGTELRELTINMTQTDHSAVAPRPGVQSYQVFVDGSPVIEPVTQTCEEGNCGMEGSWSMDPTKFSNGSHSVRVEAVDQAGNSSWTWFEVEIERGDPCADQDEAEPEACGLTGHQIIQATEFEELEGERAEAVAEEWIQPGTKNERRANNSEATRGTTACPEDSESTCEEVRVFGPESESDDQLFVTVSTDLEDPDLETVTDLNAFVPDEGQEPIATGPINEALAPWQDAPPGHGSTYEAFEDVPKLEAPELEGPELEPEEEEVEEEGLGVKTIWWIDSKTGLPLRKLEEVGPNVRRFYFDFSQREQSADELPPDFFLAEMPPWGVAEVVRNVEDEPGDLTYIEVGE